MERFRPSSFQTKRESLWGTDMRKGFPVPSRVLEAALAQLREDGSMLKYDKGDKNLGLEPEWYKTEASKPIQLDSLPDDVYAHRLLEVARSIFGTVMHLGKMQTEDPEKELQILARHLSAYRNEYNFVRYASSLVKIDKGGSLIPPHLPKGAPWTWVQDLREEIRTPPVNHKKPEEN